MPTCFITTDRTDSCDVELVPSGAKPDEPPKGEPVWKGEAPLLSTGPPAVIVYGGRFFARYGLAPVFSEPRKRYLYVEVTGVVFSDGADPLSDLP